MDLAVPVKHDDRLADALLTEEARRVQRVFTERRSFPLDRYRYSLFDRAHRDLHDWRERAILELLPRAGVNADTVADMRILEIGCGAGDMLGDFLKYGAHPEKCVGVDLMEDDLQRAASKYRCTFSRQDASRLAIASGSFDVVMQLVVFTSILSPLARRRMAAEMDRVLRPGGVVLWYEFRADNPQNPNVRGMPVEEMKAVFPPTYRWIVKHLILKQSIARRVPPWLGSLLSALPWLRTHYAALGMKP